MNSLFSISPSNSSSVLSRNSGHHIKAFPSDDYLNEFSCNKIHNLLRKNYFERVDQASLKNFLPKFVYYGQEKPKIVVHYQLPEIKNKSKKIQLSEKIRKNNKSRLLRLKEEYKKELNKKKDDVISEAEEDYKNEIQENEEKGIRKAKLPKLQKKVLKDPFPIIYETKYIDNVEEKYIKPYHNKTV